MSIHFKIILTLFVCASIVCVTGMLTAGNERAQWWLHRIITAIAAIVFAYGLYGIWVLL